ncbi:hypothetical protein [Flavobacterium sp. FlaQc-47]|uniref:hypothetical protein n=1 Tax=Flavobacterium sp. FlaQc-47 TaxID=3374180 RepID=UPI00375807DB
MIFESKIINHFESNWIKRDIKSPINQALTVNDITLISEIGLPNDILDFNFTNEIYSLSLTEIVIGNTYNGGIIILNTQSGNITKDNNCFLANSLHQLVLQLYVYDNLWKNIIPNKDFGNYRENHNHKKYAQFMEQELLKIDPDLLNNDTHYFWSAFLEDIESGIVG